MSIYTVKEGRHYSWPFFPRLWAGKQRIGRYIRFDESFPYTIEGTNEDNVNKIFGLGFGLRGHQYHSGRVGAIWSRKYECVKLIAYCYTAGRKNWDEQLRYPELLRVPLHQEVYCEVSNNPVTRQLQLWGNAGGEDQNSYTLSHGLWLPSYGYTLGPYFGGQIPATHDTRFHVSKTSLIHVSKSPFS